MNELVNFMGRILPAWAARRLQRQLLRHAKREAKHAQYHLVGLNGTRARARRRRQNSRRLSPLAGSKAVLLAAGA